MQALVVTAAVIERDGRVLIARRARGSLAGFWEFPGGKLEPDEAPEDCLVRELREELGCETEVVAHLMNVEHDYPELRVRLLVYRVRVVSGEPRAIDHEQIAWVLPQDLGTYKLAPADLPIVARL